MLLDKCRRIILGGFRKIRRFLLKAVINYTPSVVQLWILRLGSTTYKNPDLTWYLGRVREKRGNYEGALVAYQAAIDIADSIGGDSPIKPNRQVYQFSLEKARFILGKEHEEDPFHHCHIQPNNLTEDIDPNSYPGTFKAIFKYNGLRIKVNLNDNGKDYFDLLIDGTSIRRVKVVHETKEYNFTVKRPSLAHFPKQGELSVRTSDGIFLLSQGSPTLLLNIPHGKGDIKDILKQGGYLEKKGDMPVSDEEISRRQNYYLQLYSRARDFFDAELGRPLFLMYGTLLGLYREGDFIKGDDDFDVGYISEEKDPVAVKEEAKRIIMKLVQAGFTVSFNQAGRPFRLRDSDIDTELHLDIRPVWFQNGKIWAHKQACLSCTLDDFIPTQKSNMRETEVYIPHKPKVFLKAYYGPGWKVPDPSYSNDTSLVDPNVRRKLARACLTIGEFKQMRENLKKGYSKNSNMGELIFKAAQDLYPLEEYEAKCSWS